MYAYLVVGNGLFGSAAARYLSARSDSVALIGPDEPESYATHEGVFASHYDEARIVSQSAPDETWVALEQATIQAFATIETQSGIPFFTATGRLSAVERGDSTDYPYLPNHAPACTAFTDAEFADTKLHPELPFRFPPNYDIVLEEPPSGFLNPRAMVRAQSKIAEAQGAHLIRQMVRSVRPQTGSVEVALADGQVLLASKVLLTGGSFTNCFDLVERKLAIKPESVPILLAQVNSADAQRLRNFPPLNFKIRDPELHLSILPPLPYPDGQTYIKVVINSDEDRYLPDFPALAGWFRGDASSIYTQIVQDALVSLLPEVAFHLWQTKPCVVSYTPSGKPMIDCLDRDGPQQLFVAVGGNLGAAHSSDAIGKLAADLMLHEQWLSPIERGPFRVAFADQWVEWINRLA